MITEGYYVASHRLEGYQIGYDWFQTKKSHTGFTIESRHTIFGALACVQTARFEVDEDWTPKHLSVKVPDQETSCIVEFSDAETVVIYHTPQGRQGNRFNCPVPRQRALFLLNGGFYFPLHVVRRFPFETGSHQRYDLIPQGLVEVIPLKDIQKDGQYLRVLEMRMAIGQLQDTMQLYIDDRYDLVRYNTQNSNLQVQFEREVPHA